MITTGIVKSTFIGISESKILLSKTDVYIDRDSIPAVKGGGATMDRDLLVELTF